MVRTHRWIFNSANGRSVTSKNSLWHWLSHPNAAASLVTAVLFVMVIPCLLAQSGRANITGVVMDSQGAVVAGATVTATNVATGVVTPATTNGSGVYNIIQIMPGVYT